MSRKPKTVIASEVPPPLANTPDEAPLSIAKPPSAGGLEAFRSKRSPNIAGVETLFTGLPHYKISEAKDYVRLHPDEDNCWSAELCFVDVPIKGVKQGKLHLINEAIAMRHLPSARIQRFRLALASKPYDVFFLCHVPTRNSDNSWNKSSMEACEKAKTLWTQATSRKEEGVEAYKIDFSRDPDAYHEPNWPKQTLDEIILATFANCMIEREDHPGLLRLIGAKISI